MQRVKIITERLASMSYKFAKKHGIALLPVSIMHKGDTIQDDNDEKANDFLQRLQHMEEIPTTGAPPLGQMINFFQDAMKDLETAIYITPSVKLSSIHDHGLTVAKKLKDKGKDIRVFDSGTTVSMQGMYAYEANLLAKQGKDIDSILNHLEKLKENRQIVEYGVLETLKFLEKNGRIGKAKAWIAGLFSFKPIITAKDGILEPIARVRTNAQGLDMIVDKIREDMKRTNSSKIKVMYDYGLDDEYVRSEVAPKIKQEFDAEVISFNQISTVIACHMGPEIWGVCVKMEK